MTKQQQPLGRPAARVSASLLALLLAVLFAAASLLAGGCGGGGSSGGGGGTLVVGRVRDSANKDAPVPDAQVEIGGRTTLTSHEPGKEGEFSLSGVPAGVRTATITVAGVDPQVVSLGVAVTAGVTNQVGDLFINIGSVSGRVFKADGTPAANAFVTILSSGAGTNAEADGTFSLRDVPPGATEITVVLGTQSATVTVTVGESGITDVGDVRLQDDPNPNPPGAPQTITGIVALPAGAAEPLAGTTVILLRAETNAELERSVTYDEQGHYGFYVPVGNYRIVARRAGYVDAIGDISVTDPSVPAIVNLTLTR